MSNSLFQIADKYAWIAQELEALEGELTPELESELQINEEEFHEKVKAYRAIIKKWGSDIEAAKVELARVTAFKKSREYSIEKLTSNVDFAMRQRSLKKLDLGVHGMISYRASTSVDVDESILGTDWFRIKTEAFPDKVALAQALKDGKEIPGAKLVTKDNIQIK